MSAYRHLTDAWRKPEESYVDELMQRLAVSWRREPAVKKLEAPTRLDRARRLGYKAKQGIAIVRVRLRRGGAAKKRPVAGRRLKSMGVAKFKWGKSMKRIAEERAAKKFPNLQVLNSYWIWQDGTNKWFEVVMVDPMHPVVKSERIRTGRR